MTRFVALQLAKDHYFNIAAAEADFGYRPRISTQEAVERTVKSFAGAWARAAVAAPGASEGATQPGTAA
jgi:hypothetical protein